MRALAYSPRPGPLGSSGPGAVAGYLSVLAAIVLVFESPVLIAAAGLAVVIAGVLSGVGGALRAAARWGIALALLLVAVNALVVRRGETVLVRGFDLPLTGPLDVTLEALVEGGVLALRVLVVLLAFAVLSACADPDRILNALRPLARRSALTATLITRLVPLAGRDYGRLREAAASRGPAAAPVTRGAGIVRLVSGSLERATDVAATVELRGYGLSPPKRRRRPASLSGFNRSSALAWAVAAATGAIAIAVGVSGGAQFSAYPTVRVDLDRATLAAGLTIALLALPLLFRRSAAVPARWSAPPGSGRGPRSRWSGKGPELALEIEALSYRYPGARRQALDGVDLAVRAGELVVLRGASGSGKSSLLRSACGLIPHFHGGTIGGRVAVGGRVVRDHGPAELAASVGYVAQDPETQVVSAIAGAEVEMPIALGRQAAEARKTVARLGAELGISHLLERPVDSLSAGELQRVAIAAALASEPGVLLLDEPTSQLDPESADALVALVRAARDRGLAVLVAEHRLSRWRGVADRTLVVDHGRLAEGPASIDVSNGRSPGATRAENPSPNGDLPPGRSRALSIDDLTVELGTNGRPALDRVALAVDRRSAVALLGANGAGKSTLLRASAGLVEPTSGHVDAPQGCAFLGQHPGDYLVRERVADELPGHAGVEILSAVDLEWAADRDPRDLSGGERQRLALAISLAGRGIGGDPPGLVCLDEPTRGMDSAQRRRLVRLLVELRDQGAGVLVATHDLEFVRSFAERVVMVSRGAVVADGAPGDVLPAEVTP